MRRIRVVGAAAIGLGLAVLLGWHWLGTPGPTGEATLVSMRDWSGPGIRWPAPPATPSPPPDAPAQPALPTASSPEELAELDVLRDRADWVGGAVVRCNLGVLDIPNLSGEVHVVGDPDGLGADQVDGRHQGLISRLHDGWLNLVVTTESGLVEVHASRTIPNPRRGMGLLSRPEPVRVSWTGATPGSEVTCSAAWRPPTATVRLTLVDAQGQPFDRGSTRDLVLVHGCGFGAQVFPPTELTISPGACSLQVLRAGDIPLLRESRSDPVPMDLAPGQTVSLTVEVPPSPGYTSGLDLEKTGIMADLAAWSGKEALSDALQDLVSSPDPAVPDDLVGLGGQMMDLQERLSTQARPPAGDGEGDAGTQREQVRP